GASARSPRRVQGHGGANQRLECLFIYRAVLMDIDGTPGVAFEAGVEEATWVGERGALGECEFHLVLVGLARADDAAVRPHWNPRRIGGLSPFHLLDHIGVGLLDHYSDPSEHVAAPIVQLLDSRIDLMRGRAYSFSFF